MAAFRFSRRAEADLLSIGNYTLRTWGKAQTTRYIAQLEVFCQTLADNPALGRTCDEVRPGLRRLEHGALAIGSPDLGVDHGDVGAQFPLGMTDLGVPEPVGGLPQRPAEQGNGNRGKRGYERGIVTADLSEPQKDERSKVVDDAGILLDALVKSADPNIRSR